MYISSSKSTFFIKNNNCVSTFKYILKNSFQSKISLINLVNDVINKPEKKYKTSWDKFIYQKEDQHAYAYSEMMEKIIKKKN